MPADTRVHNCYQDLRRQGKPEGSAAAICQASTGQALATGRAPKKSMKLTAEEIEAVGKTYPQKANSYSQDVNAGRVPRNNPPAGDWAGKKPAAKAWSEEARQAALLARGARSHSAANQRMGMSQYAHSATDAANAKPSRESHNRAALAHERAGTEHDNIDDSSSRARAQEHFRMAQAHRTEAKKPKPGKIQKG